MHNSDEISLQQLNQAFGKFWKYLLSKKISFLLTCIVGIGSGLGYYFIQTPVYTAECTFIVEEKSSGGNGLAGLASQFGIDFGGVGSNNLFAGDNLLEIIPSKKIVEQVLLSRVDTSNKKLADLFLEFTKLKRSWADNEKLAVISFENTGSVHELNLLQDSVLTIVYNNVVKSYLSVDWARKKASLIKVTVSSKNEKFSKYLTERVVEQSKDLYINLKTTTALSNVKRLQNRADSLLGLLNNKSYEAASTQILNANPAIKSAQVPAEIFIRDKTVLGTIYAEVVKNLETSKILLNQQTPVIQVIDEPQFPLVKEKQGKVKLMLVGMLICIFSWAMVQFWRYTRLNKKHEN